MSVFQVGVRVVISFGSKQGCKGVIQGMTNSNGVGVVEVLLDGESEPQSFRPSLLVRDTGKGFA